MVRGQVGKVKGRFCAVSKKELQKFACSQKIRCRAVKVGKAVIAGKISGLVYCCKRRSAGRRIRRRRTWVYGGKR